MRGVRAKDSDRDRYVELIEAAYVDGQLNTADRELRVSRALTAQTLDDLETLTRDLQPPPGTVRPDTRPAWVTEHPAMPHLRRFVLLAVMGVAVLLIGAVTTLVSPRDAETAAQGPAVEVPTVAVQEPPAGSAAPEGPAFRMTPGGVRAFVRDYEAQFRTLEAHDAGVYPTWVNVSVPVRGSRPRAEGWAYDGTWRQTSAASAAIRPGTGTIDLGTLGVRRLFANMRVAKRTLGVEQGEVSHVSVRWWGDVPDVNIYVSNEYGESGYLKTTMAGDRVLGRWPYDP